MLRLPKRVVHFISSAVLLCSSAIISAQTNGVLREIYYNIGGSAVSDLTNAAAFPSRPDDTFIDGSFEAPVNFADNYGQRMRALLLPPVTGSYIFFIASDDNSVLYLSTDEDPTHKRLIAADNSWANSRQWNSSAAQKSTAISLTNGARYYVEALQKEGGGGDNLGVAWQKPGDPAPADGAAPIAGNYLLPYGLGPPIISVQPVSIARIEAETASFTIQLAQKIGALYQWQRNGAAIAGATNSVYGFAPVVISDSGAKFTCAITNAYGYTNSTVATLTVNADITAPTLVSVGTPGNPQILAVVFSEPVESTSATLAGNYTINNEVKVLAAAFALDNRTVLLTTTPMVTHTNYTLTVNNVRDRANTPNVIAPDTQWTFTLDTVPLDISFVRPNPEPIGPSTRHGPLVISEIMYHPATRADGKNLEFLELYNSNPFFEDISGYRLAGQVDFTFPSNTVLQARSYLVIAAAPADLQSVYPVIPLLGPYTNSLSNGSGTVRVLNREGGVVFEVSYSGEPPWPAAADGAGHSLVLARPSLGAANPAAWDASDLMGGSPGGAESIGPNPYRTVVINEILAHTDPPDVDYIELFNYSSAPVDLSGCILTDDPTTNKFSIPTNTVIQPQGFVYFDETQLGFGLSAAGETLLFKSPAGIQVLDALRFGAQENGVAFGRFPDGAKDFYRLQAKTPGTNNAPWLNSGVVINELMYDPLSGLNDDEYVELFNRTGSAVDLSGWSLEDGIHYTIPQGTLISPNGYVVIARNAARLLTNYSNLTGANTLGDFSGSLAHGGERVALAMPDDVVSTNSAGGLVTNHLHIVVDEVTYSTGGRWGKWAHGGGSSLELIDPNSDHRRPSNWVDSDETSKSGWTTVQYTGVLDNGNGPADSLQIITLGTGEYLVDNVEVFAAGGQNLLPNPTFDMGLTGWVTQGNHEDSYWEPATGYNSTGCLHVRATDHGDTGANRIRATLSSPLNPGVTATLRAKVRWLKGHPELLLRLKGNWLEATGNTFAGAGLGTPGAPNSRLKPNAGPAIDEVKHSPVVPLALQAVTVTARVSAPPGLSALLLKYRIDPATNYNTVAMTNRGAGLFSAAIPGQPGGTISAFCIQALDNASPHTMSQFPDDAPARECLVRWGDPAQAGTFGTYRVWMTQATFDRWSKREHLSNKPLDCTFVYGNSRVIYNIGGQYSGSPWHAPGFDSPIGNVCDYLLSFPDDDPLLGETDATLQWPGNGGGDNSYQREQTAYWMAEQMGLPYCYRRSVNMFVNGVRRAQLMEDVQQPNGDMADEFYPAGSGGDLHKVQLWFEFDDAAVNFTSTGASLQNFTTTGGQKKLPVYRWTLAKRAIKGSASNYTNLFGLVNAANFSGLGSNYRRQLETALDPENWLKTYAVEHVVGNNDSFAYGGGQNMYAYKPAGDTWKMMIWDIDFAFSSQPPTSDVFQGIGRSCGIDLGEPAYLRRYWQILQDLVNGPLLATRVGPLLDAKYSAMTSNGRTVDNPSAIKDYISQRRASVLGLIRSNVSSSFSVTTPPATSPRNLISLSGTAPVDLRTITINGIPYPVTWTSVSIWTAQIALTGGMNSLLVQGWDSSSNLVTGASANISVDYNGPVELPQDKIVFNEIMYHPAAPNASFIELYNTSATNAFDLTGWRLDGVDFTFPAGTILAPGGFLVIAGDRLGFASAYGSSTPLVGIFSGKLDNNGETLRLIKPGLTQAEDVIVDQVRYSDRAPWLSQADGTGSSLQLIDPLQDSWRVGNWSVVFTNAPQGSQWQYVTLTGIATRSTLLIGMSTAGDVYVDDLKLVAGDLPEVGENCLTNGGFESPLAGSWNVSANVTGSAVSTAFKHSGSSSLHVVATSGGATIDQAIWQNTTSLITNGTYTLSFWYLPSTNGSSLLIRLWGSSPNSGHVYCLQPYTPSNGSLLTATPGAPNSGLDTLPPFPPLWLNELQAENLTGITNQAGGRAPWLELYNPSTNSVLLDGLYLSANYTNLTAWAFPSGSTINPKEFKIVFADGQANLSSPSELHANFVLPKESGSLALSRLRNGQTQVLDFIDYEALPPNHSYGSFVDGQSFKRQQFYLATPGGTNDPVSPPLTVAINEWMAGNTRTLQDPLTGKYSDWFELFNYGTNAVDLAGYYLTDSPTNPLLSQIPAGYTIPPQGFLLVWADGNSTNGASDLHANFKLSKNGESIGLYGSDGRVVDFVSYGVQADDISQGRFPDGVGSTVTLSAPTPRAVNFFSTPNTPPSLAALSNTVVFEGQVLSFAVPAIDNDLPAQHLSFSLAAGAPAGATIAPATGLFSWRPSLAQTPSTNSITFRVTDDGVPPLTSTATFMAFVVPRPQVTSLLPNPDGGWSITIGTVPGKSYRVEFKNSLADSEWQELRPDTSATGETMTVVDSSGGLAQRFYRIVVLN